MRNKSATTLCLILLSLACLQGGAVARPSGGEPRLQAKAVKEADAQARKALATYGFPADFNEQAQRDVPLGWIDAKRNPARALLIGRPHPITRPLLTMHAGLFLPRTLPLLEGDHALIADHNAVLSLYAAGDMQGAFALLDKARTAMEAMPRASLERRSLQMLRGQLSLAEYARTLAKETENAHGETPKENSANVREWRMRAIGSLSDALERQDLLGLFSSSENAVDGALLRASLEVGFYRDRAPSSVAVGRARVSAIPVDPLRALRTFTIASLWNLAVMQAEGGNWQSAFELAHAAESTFDKLGDRAPVFEGEVGEPLASLYDVDTVENGLWILPRRREDMVASLSLLRSHAALLARDPVAALEYADDAIRHARARSLAAAAFHLAANIYFDLRNESLAANAFQWSAEVAPSYERKAPSLVFFRAENNFWLGKRAEARAGFTHFLKTFGDRTFGPWARLRLAELDAAASRDDDALVRYAQIRSLHPSHPAALQALVRLFCAQERAPPVGHRPAGLQARTFLQEEVLASLVAAPLALKQDAKACALGPTLARLDEAAPRARARETVALQAKKRDEPLEAYDREFPESPYAALHASERKRLSLADGQIVLASFDCKRILEYFRTHDAALLDPPAGTLAWGDPERALVGRCAYLQGDGKIWARARKERWEPATFEIQAALAGLGKARSETRERARLLALLGSGVDSTSIAREREEAGDLAFRLPEFWRLVAGERLAALSLAYEKNKAPSLEAAERARAYDRNPAGAWKDERACLHAAASFDSMPAARLSALFRSRKPAEWLAQLDAPAAQGIAGCRAILASRLLLAARAGRGGSDIENGLLLPWLRARGLKAAPEAWLERAQVLERRKGARSPEVVAAFKEIAEGADDVVVKESARAWLENRAQAGENP